MSDTETCDGCRRLDERVTRLEQILLGHPAAPAGARDESPLATSTADMVTPRQLGNVRRLARAAGVDPDEESRRLHGADTSALNRNAADRLITHLAQLAAKTRQRGGPPWPRV